MRAWITVLVAAAALAAGTSVALSGWRSEVPVYPPYPYKAGHYPTADSYYECRPTPPSNRASTTGATLWWRKSETATATCRTSSAATATAAALNSRGRRSTEG